MSLTDVINPQVGLGLMLCANRWVSLMNLYPKKVTLSLLQRIPWIINNKYKWEVPLIESTVLEKYLIFTKYFGSSTSTLHFCQSSTQVHQVLIKLYLSTSTSTSTGTWPQPWNGHRLNTSRPTIPQGTFWGVLGGHKFKCLGKLSNCSTDWHQIWYTSWCVYSLTRVDLDRHKQSEG